MSVRRNVFLSMGGQTGTLVLSLLAAIITARWLGPAGRGVLSMTVSGGYVGAALLSIGVGTGVSTLVARRDLDVWTAARISGVTVVAAFIVSLVVRLALAPVTPGALVLVAAWLPASIAMTLLSTLQTSVAIGAADIRASVTNSVVTGVMQVTGYVVASRTGNAFPGVAIAMWTVSQGSGAVIGWALLLRSTTRARSRVRPVLGEMVRLSLAAFPGLILGMANFRLDIFLLGFWSSATQVGLYSMAALGVSALAIGPSALGQALMSRFGSPDVDRQAYLRRGMVLALLVAAAIGLVAVPAAGLLVPLVLGVRYSGSIPMLYALIPGFVLFGSCYVSTSYINVVLKRPWLNGRVAGLSLAVDLVFLAVLAPSMGGLGAAIASSIAYAAGAILNLVQLRHALLGHSLAPAREATDNDRTEANGGG